MKGKYQGHRGQRSRSLCNFIGQKGTISTINDLFVLNSGKMGQMVREKHHIINKVKKNTSPKYLYYKWQAVGNVSGNRCESDCRFRGREFDPGPVPYFRGD